MKTCAEGAQIILNNEKGNNLGPVIADGVRTFFSFRPGPGFSGR